MLLALISVGVGLFIGVARKGRFRNLTRARVRVPYVLLPGLGIPLLYGVFSEPLPLAMSVISLISLLAFVVTNLHLVGIVIVGIGIMMNLVPLLANQAMPVRPNALVEANLAEPGQQVTLRGALELQDDDTFAPWLGDTIPLPETRQVLSFGDLVILVGLGDLTTNLLVRRHRRPKQLPRGAESLVAALAAAPMPFEDAMSTDLIQTPLPRRRPSVPIEIDLTEHQPEPEPVEIDLTERQPEPREIDLSAAALTDDGFTPGASVFDNVEASAEPASVAVDQHEYVAQPTASVFDDEALRDEALIAGAELTFRYRDELAPDVDLTEAPSAATSSDTGDSDERLLPARSVLDQLLARLDRDEGFFLPDTSIEADDPRLDDVRDDAESEADLVLDDYEPDLVDDEEAQLALFAPPERPDRDRVQLSLDELFDTEPGSRR